MQEGFPTKTQEKIVEKVEYTSVPDTSDVVQRAIKGDGTIDMEGTVLTNIEKEKIVENKIKESFQNRLEKLQQKKAEIVQMRKELPLNITVDKLLDIGKELSYHGKTEDLQKAVDELNGSWETHKKDSREVAELLKNAEKEGKESIIEMTKKAQKELYDEEMDLVAEMEALKKTAVEHEMVKPKMSLEEIQNIVPGKISGPDLIKKAIDLTAFQNRFIRENEELAKNINFKSFEVSISKILDVIEGQEITKKLLELKKEINQ